MIKNIIFDFGDVFINLDKPATLRELDRHEIAGFWEELVHLNQKYEKGLLSSPEFLQAFQKHRPQLSAADITASWNAILVDFPEHRLRFLHKLATENKYKLILLSNTNEIHIDWCKQHIPFFTEFENCFDAFYLSHEINQRKPDPSTFEFVLAEQQLRPEETLFIDDTKENTEAAAKLGIHVWNIDPAKEDVVDLFRINKNLF